MRIYRGYVDGEDIFFPVHKKLGELIKAIDRRDFDSCEWCYED